MGLLTTIQGMMTGGSGGSAVADLTKHFRLVPSPPTVGYRSFGSAMQIDAQHVAVIYHHGISEYDATYGSWSYAHLYRGRSSQIIVNTVTGQFGQEIQIDDWSGRSLRDCYCGKMDNGKFIYFSAAGGDAFKLIAYRQPADDSGTPSTVFFRIADDTTLQWGSRKDLIGTGAISPPTLLPNSYVYGNPKQGDTAGEMFITLLTMDITGTATPKCYCVRTTDYWQTWDFHQIWSGAGMDETDIMPLGSGKLMAVVRFNQGGNIGIRYSSDHGQTWTDGGNIQYDMWSGGFARVVKLFKRTNGMIDLWFTDRDTGLLMLSPNNDPSVFFGVVEPDFTLPKIYARVDRNTEQMYYDNTASSAGNPALGYQAVEYIGSNTFFVMFGREVGGEEAKLYYTFDNALDTSTAAPPAPSFVGVPSQFLNATSARISVIPASDAALEQTDYFQIEIASDASFTTHPNVTYNSNVGSMLHPAGPVPGDRMPSQWMTAYGLTTATTYYVRVRACNDAGVSAWVTGQFTTT